VSIVERIVTVYNDKGSKQAVKDLKKLEKDFVNAGKKIGKAFAVATVAVGAFAVKVGVDAVKGAIEDQKSQAILANALRNTTGATDEAIKAVEEYISKQQMLVAVSDTELRQSLITLTTATGDLTQAQVLQNVALDTAAGTQKDLQTVSLAIAKAYNGNIGALTKLGVSIDKTIVKNKDFKGAVDALTKAYGGAAITAADTLEGRLKQLQIAYGEILETLGYALLPVIQEFAEYIVANVLPALEQWVNTNKDELAAGLQDVGTTLITVGKLLAGFFKTISENLGAVKAFAAIFIGAKLATGIYAIVTAIGLLRAAFVKQAVAATAAGTATAFATGGASAIAAAAAIGVFVAASGAAYIAINKMTDATDKGSASTVQYNSHLNDLARVAEQVAAANSKNNKVVRTTTTNTKLLTAAEKKAAEVRAAIKKAGLDKFGIKNVSDTDPIQLEAARLNLLKQNNLEEQRRLAAIIENMNAQMMANQAVQRYVDLLGVVADQVISDQEVILLAGKWGISTDKVVAYTTAIFAVNDAKLSTEEIDLLAKQWGVTKQQAEMYLDFFKYINDGKLDQSEVNALMDKWKLTSAEVTAYAKKIADGVTPSDIWPTPGNQAAKSWRDALAALNAYLAAVGAKLAPTAPIPGVGVGVGVGVGGGGAAVMGKAAIEALTPAQAEKILSTMPSSVPTTLTPGEISGMRYAAQAAAQAAAQKKMLDSIALTDPMAQSSLQSGLAGGASLSAALSGSRYAAQAAAQYGSGTTVNVTVQGSVTTENDLVSSIRNGLLQGQNNGQAIVKSSVAI
jgi:hypothetical protein